MARMVRKQVYLEARQEAWLKRRGRVGRHEAELIRRALEHLGHAPELPPDPRAWAEARAVIVRRLGQEVPQTGRAWTRDDAYDERLRPARAVMLVDTNVLVSAHDPRDRPKPERALGVLDRLIGSGRAVLSAQCRSECFVVVTRRLPEPLAPAEALAQADRLARACRVLDVTAAVPEGCRGSAHHGLALWDALIWAAPPNQVPAVLTEDAPHDRTLEGVRFLNPFAARVRPLPPRWPDVSPTARAAGHQRHRPPHRSGRRPGRASRPRRGRVGAAPGRAVTAGPQPAPSDAERGPLDTSVFIDRERGRRLDDLSASAAVSAVTVAELQLGVLMADAPAARSRRLRALASVEALFEPLQIDADVARPFAALVAESRRTGGARSPWIPGSLPRPSPTACPSPPRTRTSSPSPEFVVVRI